MKSFEHAWSRLTALARQGGSSHGALTPPPGFSTRVAALVVAGRVSTGAASIWEWLAVRSLGVACVITVLAIATAWPVVSDAAQGDLADLADPLVVAELSP